MGNAKLSLRAATLGAIVPLALFYVSGDWISYGYFHAKATPPAALAIAVAAAKYLASCLSCVFVWSTGRDRIDERDAFWLRAAFSFLIVADALMVLLYPILKALGKNPSDAFNAAGMICFMAVQTCLIVRHSRNTRALYRRGEGAERRAKREIARTVMIEVFILLVATIPVIAAAYVSSRNATPVMAVYGVYLVISLYTAWGTLSRRFFPKRNAWMIALGMTSFFLCDVNVGLSAVAQVATPLVWTFYTPALILLAASGIDFAKRKEYRVAGR